MTTPEELGALESIASAIRGDSEDNEGICRVEGSFIESDIMQSNSFILVKEEVPNHGDTNTDRLIVPSDKVTKKQFNKWKREDKHAVKEISGQELAKFVDRKIRGGSE